jgi:hypothetical protein
MTGINYLLAFSVAPIGGLLIALWVLYINRHDMKPQDPK